MKLPFYSLLLFLLTNSAAVSNIQKIIKNTIIHVVHGDITQQPVDAIVNAANEELARGKGVCGAIFQAAEGNERKLQNYIAKNYPNGIKTGQAILTPSFDLNKKNISSIIHAVGPVYDAYTNKNEAANLLKKAYSNSLKLAQEKKLKSIAFPFISSAYFGYPKKDAADLAIEAITHFAKTNKSSITDIYIVLFEADDYKLFIEKVINFQVGSKVALFLKNAGYEVFLTRDNDSFVALDERTTQANKKKVDLFLSIHANAGSPHASGIETYWLDSKLLKNCNSIRNDTVQKLVVMKDTLSSLCAQCVHNAAIDAAKKIYNVNDRKVKTSVAQVLLGTDVMIPAALIEIGFLSNQKETKLLMDKAYQSTIAQGIANGIITYFSKCKKL
jgi:O-acetyl-ADP-ribose deacetylase